MKMEKWHDLGGFPEYQINKNGQIRSLKRGSIKILKPDKMSSGYMRISLFNCEGIRKSLRVHRLVAFTFIPNPNNYPIVDHINGIKDDNHVTNLQWVNQNVNILKSNHSFHRRKTVAQYDTSNNLIALHLSAQNAGNTLGVCDSAVTQAARQGTKCQGFLFRYVEEETPPYKPIEGEIFKIVEYNDILYPSYIVSNKGNIINVKTGMLKTPTLNNGYPNVSLNINSKQIRVNVHRLVATAFVDGQTNVSCIVNHIDENKLNVDSSNLEWITPYQNNIHSNHKRQKKVSQIDINTNEIINVYPSLKAAAAGVGLKSSAAICECCKGKRGPVRGFLWDYYND